MEPIIEKLQVIPIDTPENNVASAVTEEVTVVKVVGDVDGNTAPKVQDKILPLVQPNSKLLLDFTEVPYMSSAGVRVLVNLHRKFEDQKGKLVLVGVSENIQDTLSITGFLKFFTISKTRELGLKSLQVKVHPLPA